MTPSGESDSGDRLPGELTDEELAQAGNAVGIWLIRENLPLIDDVMLSTTLAMYHEEWARRHGEQWVISDGE